MLDDEAIARYARQIVVPGIGAAGQEKLLKSTVLVVGHPRGCATAKLYLEAAGVRVVTELAHQAIDVIVACSPSALDGIARDSILEPGIPVCWYELTSLGFECGVHPGAEFPAAGRSSDLLTQSHDAGACAAASSACAIVLDVPTRFESVELST